MLSVYWASLHVTFIFKESKLSLLHNLKWTGNLMLNWSQYSFQITRIFFFLCLTCVIIGFLVSSCSFCGQVFIFFSLATLVWIYLYLFSACCYIMVMFLLVAHRSWTVTDTCYSRRFCCLLMTAQVHWSTSVIYEYKNSKSWSFGCSLSLYEGRSINKLQNGAVPLILKIGKIRNIRFVRNLILNIQIRNFFDDDVIIVTSSGHRTVYLCIIYSTGFLS